MGTSFSCQSTTRDHAPGPASVRKRQRRLPASQVELGAMPSALYVIGAMAPQPAGAAEKRIAEDAACIS